MAGRLFSSTVVRVVNGRATSSSVTLGMPLRSSSISASPAAGRRVATTGGGDVAGSGAAGGGEYQADGHDEARRRS